MPNKQQYEQYKQVIENAPEGATHVDAEFYYIHFKDGKYYCCASEFDSCRVMEKQELTLARSLEDIKELISLYEENEKLKAQLENAVRHGFSKSRVSFNYEYPFCDGEALDELDSWVSEWAEELSNE
mgnify:CR=1 FL=1